jgi:triosephosphate isomerase (TIM)
MARVKFVAGNWKMNTTKASAVALAQAVAKGMAESGKAEVHVGVAVPFVYFEAVGQALAGSKVFLGAQDVYFEKPGAFTGEIGVDMLKDLGVKFCLNGHSERRHVLKDTPDVIAKKAHAIYAGGLTLIHCVGEKLEERDANKTLEVCKAQLHELSKAMNDPERLVIAYEPVWAIGTGRNATDAQAQEVHVFIREELGRMFNKDYAGRVRIQYGGSMKPENAKGLLSQPDVDGGLVGGASLKADQFLAIVNAAR